MKKFNYDTKIASYEDLTKMGFTQENIDVFPGLLAEVLDMIIYKNHFIYSRHVIIARVDDKFTIVRGGEFIYSFLHLVNNVNNFTKLSSERREITYYSFDYTIVYVDNQEDLVELLCNIE